MTGKSALVTGGTGGIGLATAAGLAGLGAQVGIVGRKESRAVAAAARLRAIGGPVEEFTADVSSQREVRRLAVEALAVFPRLDVLVNNVGGYWATRHPTVDGLERTFAVNQLAPFLLTNLLLDRLRASAPARVVTVSSGAQAMGRIDFADLRGEQGYSGQRAYNQSKLANVPFSYELARRLHGSGVTANVLHPGVVRTAFGQEDARRWMRLLLPVVRPFRKSPEKGAETSIYLASSAEVAGVSGRYFANRRPKKSARASYDTATAARLWDVSAALVDLTTADPSEPRRGRDHGDENSVCTR
jgi:NAD(P)-dependent dehydrogenase (short-subunit alcohol dehydrogenase family)